MKARILILICLISFTNNFGQESKSGKEDKLNYKVLGLILNGGSYYLHTDNGLIKINQKERDPFEEYYQKIYNDTTIQNPNTEIRYSDYGSAINFFNPAIDISQWAQEYSNFEGEMYLYDFMEIDQYGNYVFKPGVIGLINKEIINENIK